MALIWKLLYSYTHNHLYRYMIRSVQIGILPDVQDYEGEFDELRIYYFEIEESKVIDIVC